MTTLNDLTDVDTTGVLNGETLLWVNGNSQWEPGSTSAADEFAERGVRYVDPDGNDTNDGHSPGQALKTIQEAYDDLTTWAEATFTNAGRMNVGRIILMPGEYNVGAGVTFNTKRTCTVEGIYQYAVHDFEGVADPGAVPVIRSTGNPADGLFFIDDAAGDGFGFFFRGLLFYLDTSANTNLEGCIKAQRVAMSSIRDCQFVSSGGTNQFAIWTTQSANDNSWWHIENNMVDGNMGFFRQGGAANGSNYSIIKANKIKGSLTDTTRDPIIDVGLDDGSNTGQAKGWLLMGNSFETARTAIRADFCEDFVFMNNSGKSNNYTKPFYDLQGKSARCMVIGGMCHVDASASTTGSFIKNAGNRLYTSVPGLRLSSSSTSTTLKDEYENNGSSNTKHDITLIS